MLEEDPDLAEWFKILFNNADIPEAYDFTPEFLEDTYVDMEISLTRYGEGPELTKVKKRLWDEILSQ